MTQNLGITDEVLLTGRVASGDITDDAELRKELEKIYPTENWSDINRLMKAMKTRAVRQSGGTTEVVDDEVVYTMGDVAADPQGRTHGQDVSVQVGTTSPTYDDEGNLISGGDPIYDNYAYYAGNPSLGIEGGVIHIPKGSTFQREYLGMLNTAKSNKATADAKAIADAAAPVETPAAPISGTVPYTGDLNLAGEPLLNPFGQWKDAAGNIINPPDWMMKEWEARKGEFPMNRAGAPDLGMFTFGADRNLDLAPADAGAYWDQNFDEFGNYIGDSVVPVNPPLGADITGAEMAMLEGQGRPWWMRDSPI